MTLRPALVLGFVAVILSGCYLPVRFDAEIEISRFGAYDITFDGYLASVPLYDGLRKRTISRSEERDKVAVLKRDLKRDSATKSLSYVRDGLFNINWNKSGDLLTTRMVTFLRRNESILSLKFIRETGLITMEAATFSDINKQRLTTMGLGMEGQIRVRTDARVVNHNATRIAGGNQPIYIWDIKSIFDPPPEMNIALR